MLEVIFVIVLLLGLWRLLAKVPDATYRKIGLMQEEEDEYL